MLRNMATDPAALFRTMVAEWEKIANSAGGDLLKTGEWSRAMNGASKIAMEAQAAVKDASDRTLAAANLVSRTDFVDLSARIGRIEATLERIEAHLTGVALPAPERAKPSRGRQPSTGAPD